MMVDNKGLRELYKRNKYPMKRMPPVKFSVKWKKTTRTTFRLPVALSPVLRPTPGRSTTPESLWEVCVVLFEPHKGFGED